MAKEEQHNACCPTNCGKSFLLCPLELIFKTFRNPRSGQYAWVDLGDKEVPFLNDIRWTPEIIHWEELLNLLEDQAVHLPWPKNMFSSDLCIARTNTIPIFGTVKEPTKYMGK